MAAEHVEQFERELREELERLIAEYDISKVRIRTLRRELDQMEFGREMAIIDRILGLDS